jgi:C-terminal processing protease CtpA/Prc
MKFTRLISVLTTLVFFTVNCGANGRGFEKSIIITKDGGFMLGVVIGDVDDDKKKELNIKGGAGILEVIEDSEAERIGLKEDDIIIKFDGQEIKTPDQLHDIISDYDEEKEVAIVVNRGGKQLSLKATLKPSDDEKMITIKIEDEDLNIDIDGLKDLKKLKIPHGAFSFDIGGKGGYLGVYAENISEQMLDYFDAEYGVVIEKVIEDSPAEKAGLKAGDVIIKINDKKIEDYSDLIRALNYYDPKDKVKIEFIRKGEKKSVSVTLGEKKGKYFKHRIFKGKDDFDFFNDEFRKVGKKIRKIIGPAHILKQNLKIFII